MTKIFSILLLFSLISLFGFGQQLDSVQLNNEWRYIYPENEHIQFEFNYYKFYDLGYEEYPIWLEWKTTNDPRARLKTKALHNAIHQERYIRKEVDDSIPHDHKKVKKKDFITHSKSELMEDFGLLYEFKRSKLDQVPPVVRHLPSGKYVLYYVPFATAADRSKAKVVEHRIACVFELLNDELQNNFIRLAPNGDTLMMGTFDQGLRTGVWIDILSNLYDYYDEDRREYATYKAGIKNGISNWTSNGDITRVENYSDGKKVGNTMSVTLSDSILYDEISIIYPFVRYTSLEWIYGNTIRHSSVDFDRLAVLPDNSYLVRIQPGLFGSSSNDDVSFRDQNDSVPYKEAYDINFYPVFQTYYKIYDRKTKQLIFECYLDTNTAVFSGAGRFLNGQLFDTVWTNPETKKVERNSYDLNGKLIYSTIFDVANSGEKSINGFRAIPVYSKEDELLEYKLRNVTTRNDTIFRSIRWTVEGKPLYEEYLVSGGKAETDVYYYAGNRSYSTKRNSDGTITHGYQENDIKLEYTRSSIYAYRNDSENDLKIYYKGQPYEGPVSFQLTVTGGVILEKTKKGLNFSARTFASGGRTRLPYNASSDLAQLRVDIVELAGMHLLNLGSSEFRLKSFKSTLKNHQLYGKTELTDKLSNKVELYYSDGLPTGTMNIYSGPSKFNDEFFERNVADSTFHFSEKKNKKPYLSKTYTLSNGLLSGPIVSYSQNHEVTSVLPFVNGLKQGKTYSYTGTQFVQAEFYNDTLVGPFLLKTIYKGKYDTTMCALYDQNGALLNGFTRKTFHNGKTQERGVTLTSFQNLGDGTIFYEKKISGKTTEKGWLRNNSELIKKETFDNGSLTFSEEFTNKKPDESFDLLSMSERRDISYYGIEWNYESNKNSVSPKPMVKVPLLGYSDLVKTRYIRKYFTNGVILREGGYKGTYSTEKKVGIWKVNNYDGSKLYELNYFDSMVKIGDQEWKIIGVRTDFDSLGKIASTRYVIFEKATYECSSNDYYTERQYLTVSSRNSSAMNGWNKNYYDNGSVMNEGKMVNGLPDGLWKFYAPDGKLSQLGVYLYGKENGKWLQGDLGDKAYIGEVCIDPNDPKYEFTLHQLETDKDVIVVVYSKGKEIKRSYYDSNNAPMRRTMGISF